jgi:hypothetical protein
MHFRLLAQPSEPFEALILFSKMLLYLCFVRKAPVVRAELRQFHHFILSWFSFLGDCSPADLWESASAVINASPHRCVNKVVIDTEFDVMIVIVYPWLSSVTAVHQIDPQSNMQNIMFRVLLVNGEW